MNLPRNTHTHIETNSNSFNMYHHNISSFGSGSSSGSSNMRLNYLYPCGENEDYGRKLYIFPSVSPSPTPPSAASNRYTRLSNSEDCGASVKSRLSSISSEASGISAGVGGAATDDDGGYDISDIGDLQLQLEQERQEKVQRLQYMLRAERDSCREKEDTIVTLRRVLDEHERRLHHMDGVTRGRPTDLTKVSPTLKLLDQVARLQSQKSDLMLKVTEYEHNIERLQRLAAYVKIPVENGVVDSAGSNTNHDTIQNGPVENSGTVNTMVSHVGACSTDTEKELDKAIRDRTALEQDMKKLREENKLLLQRISSSSSSSAEQQQQQQQQQLTTTISSSLLQKETTREDPQGDDDVFHTNTNTNNIKTLIQQEQSETRTIANDKPVNTSRKAVEDEHLDVVSTKSDKKRKPMKTKDQGTCPMEDFPSATLCDKCKQLSFLQEEHEKLKEKLNAKDKALEAIEKEHHFQKQQDAREATQELHRLTEQKDAELSLLRKSLSATSQCAHKINQEFLKLRDEHIDLQKVVENALQSRRTEQRLLQDQIKQALSEISKSHDHVVSRYLKEMRLRRKYHNQLVELKGNIRVLGRVRPWVSEDGQTDTEPVVTADEDDEGLVSVNSKGRQHHFDLDRVFGMSSTQSEVFEEVSSLVRSTIDGYNVCIFAYGQTGAGKTYTMEGPSSDPGINQRALRLLFEETRDTEWEYTISASVLEIYNENIRDLLNSDPSNKLDVKMKPEGGLHVPGLVQVPVTSVDEVKEVFETGRENRATESTNMNEHSSRSHCLLCVTVQGQNFTTGSRSIGRLNLVDLAGSERLSKTQADGDRLREAKNINRSLACLGDVMHALRSRHNHVPYRNSKLTYLLQDSLGGDSKTLMIVQVAPGDKNVGETLCTLTFGQRVRAVELGAATKHHENSLNGSMSSRSVNLNSSFRSCGSISPAPSLSSLASVNSSPTSSPLPSPCPSPCPSPAPSLNGAYLNRALSSPAPSPSPSPTPGRPQRRKLPTPVMSPKPSSTANTPGRTRKLSSSSSFSASTRAHHGISRGPNPISLNTSPLHQKKWISTPTLSASATSPTPTPSAPRKSTSRATLVSNNTSPNNKTKILRTTKPTATSTPTSTPSISPSASLNTTPTSSRSASPNDTPTITPTSSPKPNRRGVNSATSASHKIKDSKASPQHTTNNNTNTTSNNNNSNSNNGVNGKPPRATANSTAAKPISRTPSWR